MVLLGRMQLADLIHTKLTKAIQEAWHRYNANGKWLTCIYGLRFLS